MNEECLIDCIKQEVESENCSTEDTKYYFARRDDHEVFVKEEFLSDQIKQESADVKEEDSNVVKSEVPSDNEAVLVEALKVKKENCDDGTKSTNVYSCGNCQLTFSVENDYETHMKLCRVEPAGKKKKHECSECNYQTDRLQNLKRHKLSHSGERPYKCPQCDYRAVLKSHVQVHIKYKHTKEKPYSCDACDYKCTQYYMLNKHKMVHMPRKPFICNICDKAFMQKNYLKNHMFNHTKEPKPFECPDCDYSTADKDCLRRHRSYKHAIEKRFQCTNCDYKCVTAGNLKKHMYKHSDDKPFKCKDCTFQCVALKRLTKHVEMYHTKIE